MLILVSYLHHLTVIFDRHQHLLCKWVLIQTRINFIHLVVCMLEVALTERFLNHCLSLVVLLVHEVLCNDHIHIGHSSVLLGILCRRLKYIWIISREFHIDILPQLDCRLLSLRVFQEPTRLWPILEVAPISNVFLAISEQIWFVLVESLWMLFHHRWPVLFHQTIVLHVCNVALMDMTIASASTVVKRVLLVAELIQVSHLGYLDFVLKHIGEWLIALVV